MESMRFFSQFFFSFSFPDASVVDRTICTVQKFCASQIMNSMKNVPPRRSREHAVRRFCDISDTSHSNENYVYPFA